VLFLDLDNFKQVNDRFGHEAGTRVARDGAQCGANPSTDLAGRYGGDEVRCGIGGAGEEGALGVGEKVRAAVQAGSGWGWAIRMGS